VAVSVNFPIAVPFTDTRSSRPVEADSVPARGDGGTDAELPAEVAGFALAGFGVPGDSKAMGVVVTPPGVADGTSPGRAAPPLPLLPPRPEVPPWPGPWFLLPPGAVFVDPPAGPADSG
jgi:hypothetical protein